MFASILSLFFLFSIASSTNCSAYKFSFNLTAHFSPLQLAGHLEGIALLISPSFSPSLPIVIINAILRLPPWWHVVLLTKNDQLFLKKKEVLFKTIFLLNSNKPAQLQRNTSQRQQKRTTRTLPRTRFFQSLKKFDGNEYIYYPYTHTFLHVLHSPPFFTSLSVYSCALLSSSLYEDIPAEKILIMQADTLILHKDASDSLRPPDRSHYYLRDFFSFGYIGAPWKPNPCEGPASDKDIPFKCIGGGNGGLSFRRRSLFVKAFAPSSYRYSYLSNGEIMHEDKAISRHLFTNIPSSLAPLSVRLQFSVESIFSPDPYGIHKPWKYLSPKDMKRLEEKYLDIAVLRRAAEGKFQSEEILHWFHLHLPPAHAPFLWDLYISLSRNSDPRAAA